MTQGTDVRVPPVSPSRGVRKALTVLIVPVLVRGTARVDAAVEHEPTGEPGPIRGTADTILGLSWLPQPGEHLGFTLWRAAWAVTVAVLAVRCADLTSVTAWAVLLVVMTWAVLIAGTATAFAAGWG